MTDLALLALRLVVGAFVAAHGAQKLFGLFGGHGFAGTRGFLAGLGLRPAGAWALAAGLGEFGGGLLLVLGLATPLAAVAVAAAMTMAIALAHWPKLMSTDGGLEYPLVLVAAVALLAATGPGALSLDAALGLALPPSLVGSVAALAFVAVVAALGTRRVPRGAGEAAD